MKHLKLYYEEAELSAKKLEKLRAEAITNYQGEVYKGFPHTYRAFSTNILSQTLTTMPETEEAEALEIFSLILTYSGLSPSTRMTSRPRRRKIMSS